MEAVAELLHGLYVEVEGLLRYTAFFVSLLSEVAFDERKTLNNLVDVAKPGEIITIRGTRPPCKPGCIPAMRQFAQEHGVKIMYEVNGKIWVFE